jgi:hypothetical protein
MRALFGLVLLAGCGSVPSLTFVGDAGSDASDGSSSTDAGADATDAAAQPDTSTGCPGKAPSYATTCCGPIACKDGQGKCSLGCGDCQATCKSGDLCCPDYQNKAVCKSGATTCF